MLNVTDIARIKYHLDYPMVKYGLDPQFYSWISYIQIDYNFENVLENIGSAEEQMILQTLNNLDELEKNIIAAKCVIKAKKVGDIETDPDYLDKIFKLYDYYVRKLIGQIDHRLSFRNQNTCQHNMSRQKAY